MKHLKLFLVILCTLSGLKSQSQTTGFIHYGVEHGLPQSQVQSIVQDLDGNLWIGTLSGLSKYNGQSFSNFSKKDGLAEDWVTSLTSSVSLIFSMSAESIARSRNFPIFKKLNPSPLGIVLSTVP